MWHVTHDIWHVTRDAWHMACDMLWGVNILFKIQLPSSYGLWYLISGGLGGNNMLRHSTVSDYTLLNEKCWYGHCCLNLLSIVNIGRLSLCFIEQACKVWYSGLQEAFSPSTYWFKGWFFQSCVAFLVFNKPCLVYGVSTCLLGKFECKIFSSIYQCFHF